LAPARSSGASEMTLIRDGSTLREGALASLVWHNLACRNPYLDMAEMPVDPASQWPTRRRYGRL